MTLRKKQKREFYLTGFTTGIGEIRAMFILLIYYPLFSIYLMR